MVFVVFVVVAAAVAAATIQIWAPLGVKCIHLLEPLGARAVRQSSSE